MDTQNNVIELFHKLPNQTENDQVCLAIQSIKRNVNNKSIHMLWPFIVNCMCSPELLSVLPQEYLLDCWDAINDELKFRREERMA